MCTALKNVLPQNFKFPSPVINYILDQSCSTILSKLYKTCKIFYSKKRLVLIDKGCFGSESGGFIINWKFSHQNYSFCKNIKLFVRNEIHFFKLKQRNIMSKIIKNVVKCDIQCLVIEFSAALTWNEFELLAKNVTQLHVDEFKIVEYGSDFPPLEEIIIRVPNVTWLAIVSCNITPTTSENLLKISRNQPFTEIYLSKINGPLNPEKFFEFLQKHAAPKCKVSFIDINVKFQATMEAKILTWNPANEMPKIGFFPD